MGLETGTFINDLINTNPPNSDPESQGAGHLRLIKSVLQNSLPGSTRAWPIPTTSVKTGNYSVVTGDQNSVLLANTGGGAFTFTLPSLGAGDAGWQVWFLKISTDANPFLIAPGVAGSLQSGELTGLTSTRRCIVGRRTFVLWTGTQWVCDRVAGPPVGSIIPFHGAALPVGYEWPNGQTLGGLYPDYFAKFGNLATPDLRGRAIFGLDNMGGGAVGRISVGGLNWDGTIPGNAGGNQNHQLAYAEMPQHQHHLYFNDASHSHGFTALQLSPGSVNQSATGGIQFNNLSGTTTGSGTGASVGSSPGVNNSLTDLQGSSSFFTIMPPGMTEGMMLVVE